MTDWYQSPQIENEVAQNVSKVFKSPTIVAPSSKNIPQKLQTINHRSVKKNNLVSEIESISKYTITRIRTLKPEEPNMKIEEELQEMRELALEEKKKPTGNYPISPAKKLPPVVEKNKKSVMK